MKQRTINVNGVELWAEIAGEETDPAIVLIHGGGDCAMAWEDDFVRRLVAGGRRVVRFDSRGSGRSTFLPGSGLRDLADDTAGLIAAIGVDSAHVVGISQGAGVAQLLALGHPERVASLTLTAATPGGPGHDNPDLPGISAELSAFFANETEPDWSDRDAVVDYLVQGTRPFAARSRAFDEAGTREAAARTVDHAVDVAAQLTNSFMLGVGEPWRDRLDRIRAATLVLHGDEDPFFPIEHGRALAAEIPGARLLVLKGTGHEIPRRRWDVVIPAILDHTGHGVA